MPLRNRQVQIPGGLKYMQSETSWTPERYSSFDSIVTQLIAHRQANPWLVQKNGWAVDRPTVEFEVDNYNTAFCKSMGGQWLEYITEGGSAPPVPFRPPPPNPLLQQLSGGVAAVRKLASGVGLLFDWDESGEAPASAEWSGSRAAVCAVCPKNQASALTEYVTGPLAAGFKARLARLHEMNLTTPSDDKLFGCAACLCPLRLKVHAPKDLVQKKTSAQVRSELDPSCWILSEAT